MLRDAGYACTQGVLYYHGSRQRIDVPLDEALVERTRRQVADLRALAASATIPPPLVDSPKCPGCSLVGICLPDETNLLSGRASPVEHVPIRRLVPARDDALPVYVQTAYGAVGVRGDRIVVTRDKEEIHTSRLLDVAHLCLLGRITVSPHAVHVLCERGIPITHMSSGGWFYGVTKGMPHKNVDLRIAQYRSALDDSASLRLARVIVAGKVRNQRTLLRRNLGTRATAAVAEMTRLLTGIGVAPDLGQLLGHEGAAARTYFAHLGAMLSPSSSERRPWSFDFSARNRRPPRDPVNAVLSLGYALLTKDAFLILDAVGLDAYLGFLHRPRYGRPALALDLAEEFRALIVDSVVLTVLNTGEITPADFVERAGACALTTEGRRRFIAAYERRMDTLVRHPLFGYSISYRRVLEVQARVLARTLLGELRTYRSFVTR